MKTDFL